MQAFINHFIKLIGKNHLFWGLNPMIFAGAPNRNESSQLIFRNRAFGLHLLGAALFAGMFAALPSPALAQSSAIGAAARVQNTVSGIVGGRSQALSDGSSVYPNELVKTEADSLAKLTFLDQTNLSVGPSSQVKLDKFVFDPNKSASAVAVSMSTGAFRFVTGNSDPAKFKLTTPAAAIGLRGTILDINNTATKTIVVLVEGGAQVCARLDPRTGLKTDKPKCTELTQPGDYVVVQNNGVISPALPGGPAVFQFANLCSGGSAEICATFKPTSLTQTASLGGTNLGPIAIGGLAVGLGTLAIVQANQKSNPLPPPPPPVPLLPQTINFTGPGNQLLSAGSTALTATATSGLPVSFASVTPGICSVAGASVSFIMGGQCIVTADQPGDSVYAAAPQVVQSFNITSSTNNINFTSPSTPVPQSSTPVQLFAVADSGDPVIFTSATPVVCVIDGGDPTMVDLLSPGVCTINANDPGNAFYPAAAQVTKSFTVQINSNVITFPTPPDTAQNDGPVPLNASATSGTPVTYTSSTPATCSVAGSNAILLAAGPCTIVANELVGNPPNYGPAAPVSQTFQVLPALPAPTAGNLTVNVPFASPGVPINLGALVTGTFSSIAIATAPTHGPTSSLSGFVFTYIPAKPYSGPDSFTYTATGPGGTSAPGTITINVSSRPDPSLDPDVIGLVRAEVGAMQRFGQAQMDNVNQRLEALHEDDIAPVSNGLNVATGGALPSGASALLDGSPAKPKGASLGIASAFPAANGLAGGGRIQPQFYIWTGGSVSFGNQSAKGLVDNHFTTSGVSVGIDTKFMDGLKGGVAFGFGADRTKVGLAGTRSDGNFYSATAYASWRMLPQTFLDATFGFGSASFDTRRFIPADSLFVTGKRDGTEIFGSLALTNEQKWGALKLAPYARVDLMRIMLGRSTETGSDVWALNYARLNQTSITGVLGLRAQYPVEMSWGVLTPTSRLEYRHSFDQSFKQVLNYADQPGGPYYTLTGQARARDTLAVSLGLQAKTFGNVTASFDYQVSVAAQKLQAQTLRALLSVGF